MYRRRTRRRGLSLVETIKQQSLAEFRRQQQQQGQAKQKQPQPGKAEKHVCGHIIIILACFGCEVRVPIFSIPRLPFAICHVRVHHNCTYEQACAYNL